MSKEDFGEDWGQLFPAIVGGRSQFGQAIAQLAAILTTLGIAVAGGTFAGFVMKCAGRLQFGSEFTIPARDSFEDRFCILGEEDLLNTAQSPLPAKHDGNGMIPGVDNQGFEDDVEATL